MKCLHNKIKVQFDSKHNRVYKIGDIELIRPDEWVARDKHGDIKTDADGNSKFEENVNYLETKPQICEVLIENPSYPCKVGDKLFTHYMAFETATNGNLTDMTGFIIAEYIILTFNPDGTYKMADGIYLGEEELTEEVITPGGIYLSGGKPKMCEIKLCHLPTGSPFEKDQVVLTIDNYNYPCTIDGKRYIMLRENEIVATLVDNG